MTIRRNFAFYLLHQGSRFLFPLVMTPFLAHTLGAAHFADFVIWNSCVWTAALLMEFGFYIYAINVVAVAAGAAALEETVGGIVTAKLALLPLAIAGYLAGTYALGLAGRQPAMVAVGIVAVTAYGGSLAWYFQGLQQGRTAVLLEALPQLAQFALVFTLVRTAGDAWIAAGLQSLAAAVTVLISIALLRRHAIRLRWRWSDAMGHARGAVPYFVERVSYTLYATSTPLLLSILSDPRQAAFYGLAEKVNVVLIAIVAPITQAAAPVVAQRVRRDVPDWSLSRRIILGCVAVVFAASAIAFFTIGPIIHLILGDQYAPAAPVARWFCGVAVFLTIELTIANFVLVPAERGADVMRGSLLALVSSLALQWFLVPAYGAVGSTMARLGGEIAISIWFVYLALRITRARQRRPGLSRAMD